MASGYSWHPIWKETAIPGGTWSTWDLWVYFPETAGPTKVDLSYKQVERTREDVNHADQRLVFGFRAQVKMTLPIFDITGHTLLAQMVSHSIDRGNYKCELSLDGGITFREVVLVAPPSPRPISGKTIVGAEFDVTFGCKNLLTTFPPMYPSATNKASGGDFETWAAGLPVPFLREGANGTITQYTGDYHGGTKCARLQYAGTSPGSVILHNYNNYQPGGWYLASLWAKSLVASPVTNNFLLSMIQMASGGVGITYFRAGTALGVYDPATGTWGAHQSWNPYYKSVPQAWTLISLWIPMPLTIGGVNAPGNNMSIAMWGSEANHDLLVDDFQLVGPYPAPGGANW